MRWFIIVLLSFQSANAREQAMFNACDNCRAWVPSKTAHLFKALDNHNVPFELWSLGSVVILSPPKEESMMCYEYFALFLDSRRSCQDFSRGLKIKCELTVTPVTGN